MSHISGTLLGVDGCRGGWIVCARPANGRAAAIEWSLIEKIDALDSSLSRSRIAIDMPIGLLEASEGVRNAARECDREARRRLGRRACTLFTPPSRQALGAQEFRSGLGVSLQSFHLFPKLRELDAWITRSKQARVHEAHPELAFARLRGGEPIELPKRTREGREARLNVLRERLGREIGARVEEALDRWPRRRVAADDLIDAACLSIVAEDIDRGDAQRYPAVESIERDPRGLRMEIWS